MVSCYHAARHIETRGFSNGHGNRKRTNATETGATKDMTVGSPIRLIVSFATPMLIGNIFQQIYTMIDTMEMGYFVGDSAISAIGAASASTTCC